MTTEPKKSTDPLESRLPSDELRDDNAGVPGSAASAEVERRTLRRRTVVMVAVALLVAVAIGAMMLIKGRESSTRPVSQPSMTSETIQSYFRQSDITATPVYRGQPGAPTINFSLPQGWSDAGPDAPPGAYAGAFFDASTDIDHPSSLVILLSKLSGTVDPAKVLEYAPGELQNLPGYKPISQPARSSLSGFDAIQLGGLYTRGDGTERVIAQKTVVIPSTDGMYVLQLNMDSPTSEAAVLQEATAVLDEQSKITP